MKPPRLLARLTLAALVLLLLTGCGPSKRDSPVGCTDDVVALTDCNWTNAPDGTIILNSATMHLPKNWTAADLNRLFREGYLVSPCLMERILAALGKVQPMPVP